MQEFGRELLSAVAAEYAEYHLFSREGPFTGVMTHTHPRKYSRMWRTREHPPELSFFFIQSNIEQLSILILSRIRAIGGGCYGKSESSDRAI